MSDASKFQNIKAPYLTIEEQGSEPATPDAGTQRLFIDSADHLPYLIDESDVVTPVGGIATDLDIGSLPSDTPTSGDLIVFERAGDRYQADVDDLPGGGGGGGAVVQKVNTQTGALATGTTTIPFDDTIPQNTEGDQYMSLAITPTDAANILYIDVVIQLSYSVAAWTAAALFQDSTAGALAAIVAYQDLAGAGMTYHFRHKMVAGTTSPTTFKVRAGGQTAGTTTFNGQGGGRIYGGVMASSITIEEVVP